MSAQQVAMPMPSQLARRAATGAEVVSAGATIGLGCRPFQQQTVLPFGMTMFAASGVPPLNSSRRRRSLGT